MVNHILNLLVLICIDTDNFLELIEAGKITVDFKILTHGDGDDFGKPNDKGTSFIISEDDLDILFEKIPIRNYIFS